MTRKIALLGLTILLLAGIMGCTSKKSSDVTTGTTTKEKTESTERKTEGTSKEERPRLKLKGLGSTGDEGSEAGEFLTDDEQECLDEGALADPVLGPLVEDGDEPSTDEELQAVGILLVQCLGQERIGELLADQIAEDPSGAGDLFDLTCIEDTVVALEPIDLVSIIADPSLAAEFFLTCIDRVALAEAISAQVQAENPSVTPDFLACLEVQVLLLSDEAVLGLANDDPAAQQEFQNALIFNCAPGG